MAVYVLLFNARTDNEGIHTLRMQGIDVVLMFENEDDATRYGLMLEAQDFPEATVEAIDQEDVEDFCESAGYEYRLVPDGHLSRTSRKPSRSNDRLGPQPTARAFGGGECCRQRIEG
jgi:hypothetical protein